MSSPYRSTCPSCGSSNYIENYMVEDCNNCGLYLNYHTGQRSKQYNEYSDRLDAQRERESKENFKQMYYEMWGEYHPDDR